VTASPQRFGLSCALTTPFLADGSVDLARLAAHARSRLAAGCASVTICGTTGEGASLGAASRERILGALHGAGMELRHQLVVGIAASSIEEASAQAKQAAAFGCRTVLLPPPFYFKDATEDGLSDWFSLVLDCVAAENLRAILYHIPAVTAMPLSIALIGRLKERFPSTLLGVKDSSGDSDYARSLLTLHRDLAILIGDERRLPEAVRMGASGAISGLANVVPDLMLPLANEGRDDQRIFALVEEVLKYPVTPAVKELVAHQNGDAAWRNVAPPLSPLTRAEAERLTTAFDAIMQQAAA
jgi:4-hydroxy-tetrahydrodipicolinate synthase